MLTSFLKSHKTAVLCTVAAILVGASHLSYAKDKDKDLPRWYQVELVIFKQNTLDTAEQFKRQPFDEPDSSIYTTARSLNERLGYDAKGKLIPPQEETDTLNEDVSPEVAFSETLLNINTETPDFIAATKADLVLSKHAQMLRNRRAYTVLFHGGWQQALEAQSKINDYSVTAGALMLQAQEQETTKAEAETETDSLDDLFSRLSDEPTAPVESNLEQIAANAPPTFRQLQGQLRLYKKRFIHLESDLWFAKIDELLTPEDVPFFIAAKPPISELDERDAAVSAADFLEQGAETLSLDITNEEAIADEKQGELTWEQAFHPEYFGHIKEDRRLNTDTLYYIDHPLFGIIVQMTKVPHPSLRDEIQAP